MRLVPFIGNSEDNMQMRRNVIIDSTAVDESTAELFVTNVSAKLLVDEEGAGFQVFSKIPFLDIESPQGWRVVLVPNAHDSDSDILDDNGNYQFKVYAEQTGSGSTDNIVRASFKITPRA